MSNELKEVGPSDVTFLFKLKESKYSAIFKVAMHGKPCVMKVYRDRGPPRWIRKYREIDMFVRESTAYQRLQAKGFCLQGVTPDFYRTITKIQPSIWPDLHMFLDDKLPPNAILIEYIPNLQHIDLSNYSKHRLDEIHRILYDIHKARVYHGDARPRNMMASPGESMGNA
ncbi:hypothetical protein SI65_04238 [Aspergillus cristatus]|uniref:Protein kinase domain-containing protein n=1 Tax=Aspergillus cristatus TaxID=573508 RepID=A0A1E3BJP5_ASPCR|nr:hypothetical protein SI65_04238 [Aspergillus cristatus]